METLIDVLSDISTIAIVGFAIWHLWFFILLWFWSRRDLKRIASSLDEFTRDLKNRSALDATGHLSDQIDAFLSDVNEVLSDTSREEERKLLHELQVANDDWVMGMKTNPPKVMVEDVTSVVSLMTGIPLQSVAESEADRLLKLESEIKKHLVGQDHVVRTLARTLRRARSGLKDPKRPIGSFLLLGPTGVGKTELAKVFA